MNEFEVVGKIEMPIYTTEESRVKLKFELGLDLTSTDTTVFAKDILKTIIKFTGESPKQVDFKNEKLRLYLDSKYPGWTISSELKSELESRC